MKLISRIALLAALCSTTVVAGAQSSLHVIRHTPSDSGSPGSVITATFDRPVTGMLGANVDASSVMSLEPATSGIFEWRDPITLRFIPAKAFEPGSRVTVSIDTAAISSGGKRQSDRPYQFSVRFPGATVLGQKTVDVPGSNGTVGPLPSFRIMYSAPVTLDSVSATARIAFNEPCSKIVKLRAVKQRAVATDEDYSYDYRLRSDDNAAKSFRRIVELVPEDSLPPGCTGLWYAPTFDGQHSGETWRQEVRTASVFRVRQLDTKHQCLPGESRACFPLRLAVEFTAPVPKAAALRTLHSDGGLSVDRDTSRFNYSSPSVVPFAPQIVPRRRYTVTIDSTIRDVFGRRLTGPSTFTVIAPDREPGVLQQNGLVTLKRERNAPPTVIVRMINVANLITQIIPIPDSLISSVVATERENRYSLIQRIKPALHDTIWDSTAIHGTYNEERTVRVSLPPIVSTPKFSRLFALRFYIGEAAVPPDSVKEYQQRPTHVPLGPGGRPLPPGPRRFRETGSDLGMIVQVSSLVAHTKISGDYGAAFVTDQSGSAIANASIELYSGRGGPIARAKTNADGLATLRPSVPRVAQTPLVIDRAPDLTALRYATVVSAKDSLLVPITTRIETPTTAQLNASSLGARDAREQRVSGTILPDRDLFRPGETVHTKLYVRAGIAGNRVAPGGDSVRVALVRADYAGAQNVDTAATWRATLSAFGTAADSLAIPNNTRLGTFQLQSAIFDDGHWQCGPSASLRVEEFRAPEFLVHMTSDSAWRAAGDTAAVHIDGTYLFGAPMAGAAVLWNMTSMPAYGIGRTIPGTTGFVIGGSSWWEQNENRERLSKFGTDVLDVNGRLAIRLPTIAGSITQPTMLSVSAAVTDASNHSVTSSAVAFLQASSLYIAARDRNSNTYWKPGKEQTIDVMAVRPDGARMPNVPVTVTVVHHRYVRDSTVASNGWNYHWAVDTVQKFTILSTSGTVPLHVTPTEGGAYDVRFAARDAEGRATTTNLGKWADGSPWIALEYNNPLLLHVSAQNSPTKRFALGDTARVSFQSPFANADAWITVEREGILEQRRMSVHRGTTTLPFPISAAFAPNVWVGVTLIEHGSASLAAIDSVQQAIRAGYVEIRVDSTTHALAVSVQPLQAVVAPGDSVQVRVTVRSGANGSDTRGVKSEVALWAVDEGVLSMTGYKLPDLLSAMDALMGVAPNLRSTVTTLPWLQPKGIVQPGVSISPFFGAGLYALSALSFTTSDRGAGSGPLAPTNLRSDFRLTPFYVGRAVTDANGVAIIHAMLPDNITTFRLMATAITTVNQYGSGEATLLATRRVVLRAALPRFVRAGDSLLAAASLNIRTGANSNVRVSAIFTNALLHGDSVQTIGVATSADAAVRFWLTVPEKSAADATRVVFTANDAAAGDGDAVATTLPIRPTGTPRAHTVIGMVRDSGIVSVSLPADIDEARSTVSFGLGTSPIVAMRSHYDRMRAFSYYTTDVVVATARAMLTMFNAERALQQTIVVRDSVSVMTDVQRAVDDLVKRQLWDGNFVFWPGGTRAWDVSLTAFAGDYLLDAQKNGAQVPAAVLELIRTGVRNALINTAWNPSFVLGSPAQRTAHYRAYKSRQLTLLTYLRRVRTPDVALEDSIISVQDRLAWEDRVALASLMADRPELAARARAMLELLWAGVSVAGRRVDIPDSLSSGFYPSHVRPAARLLTVSMKVWPDAPLTGALGETIIQQSAADQGWGWNVHDHAAAIEALAEFVKSERDGGDAQLVARSSTGRVVFSRATSSAGSAGLAGDTIRASLAGLTTPTSSDARELRLSMHIEGKPGAPSASRTTPLYYAMTVQEVPKTRPVTPDIQGIVVERWYERLSDGKPIADVVKGDMVRVRLRVTVPNDRQFVVLEDLLPAGLEAVDLSFRTSSEVGPFARPAELPYAAAENLAGDQGILSGVWQNGWWSPWEYSEKHDDRVLYFAPSLWAGTYDASYLARATTVGTFVRPPAHAEELYNSAVQGRGDGGMFVVKSR